MAVSQEAHDPLIGMWQAIDEKSGTQMIIELYLLGDEMQGKVVSVKTKSGEAIAPVCEPCKGPLGRVQVVGATFISGLKKNDGRWVGGTVVNLRPGFLQGTVANCEIELVNDRAKIFGYKWTRAFSGENYWRRYE